MTLAAEDTASRGQVAPPPSWSLDPDGRRAVKSCLPFPFAESGAGWSWHAERAGLDAVVELGAERNSLVVKVVDCSAGGTGQVIESWVTEMRLTGRWKQRLRQLSGEAMVLAQSRPSCPRCKSPVKLRRRGDDSKQFFGCSKFPACRGSLNIVAHDVEIPQ